VLAVGRRIIEIIEPTIPTGDYLVIAIGGIARYTAEEMKALFYKTGTISAKIVQYEALGEKENGDMAQRITWKTGGDVHTLPEGANVEFVTDDGRTRIEVSHYAGKVRVIHRHSGVDPDQELLFGGNEVRVHGKAIDIY
jgi:hypothetical protein